MDGDVAEAVKATAEAESRARRGDPRAAVILGNDAVVAARPCSAAQLSHACSAAGFDIVVPPSWGDELVAGGYLEELRGCQDRVVAACACARVTSLLARSTAPEPPRVVTVVAPPVAAARFLRLVYGESLLVTYVGDCPSATDPEIDARFSPAGFFASLHRQGVFIDAQPAVMDDADEIRWQRHLSIPGGLPARRFLARAPVDRLLRDVDLAHADAQQWGGFRSRVLLDLADAAGCACGGNRASVEESEGPRSVVPILVPPPGLSHRPEPSLSRHPGPSRARLKGLTRGSGTPEVENGSGQATLPNDTAAPLAPVTGDAPAEPAPGAPEVEIPPSPRPVRPAPPPWTTPRVTRSPPLRPTPDAGRRSFALSLIPAIVLAISGVLGIAVYATSTTTGRSDTRGRSARPTIAQDTMRSGDAVRPLPPSERAPAPVTSNGTTLTSRATAGAQADSVAARTARRRLRPPAPEIVPGWLPQGEKAFTPVDTAARRRPDSSGVRPPAPPDTMPRA